MEFKSHQNENKLAFSIPGVGKQTMKHLERMDIFNVHDLLFHLPFRYQDRTQITPFAKLKIGDEVLIEGVVKSVYKPLSGKTQLLCELQDVTDKIFLRFFRLHVFQLKILKPGVRLRCYGEVRLGLKGLEIFHPEFQLLTDNEHRLHSHLTAIYPTTKGLSQHALRKMITYVLQNESVEELLPGQICKDLSLPSLKKALQHMHQPIKEKNPDHFWKNHVVAQKRLVFEELLAHRLGLMQLKESCRLHQAIPFYPNQDLIDRFLQQLPFQLTRAQERVINEIQNDLNCTQAMLRLVQGDVGSGKTVVAAMAMLQIAGHGYQVAMMAPTELLAAQHYRTLQKWFAPLGISVALLTSGLKAKERRLVLQEIAHGKVSIVLGTHALFQEAVQFSKLALVVIDEQHRFGVRERALFLEKGECPHQLMLTATPIPRTLAMSFYAGLDCSSIDELPKGRTPITTSVLINTKRDEVILRIRDACKEGRQVYWVCPLIEESEMINSQAVNNTFAELSDALPELKIGLIHGRLKSAEKEACMQSFLQGETHVLVATTVIEVGVDVANASIMIIENAERLGLAQLHQLRGRVGRGSVASYCILLYQNPLSSIAKDRLAVMRETTDGFKIAERDLELRGPGEILGVKQKGEIHFRIADLMRDQELLPQVKRAADAISCDHSQFVRPLIERWFGRREGYKNI